jgi:predicted ester cyclase
MAQVASLHTGPRFDESHPRLTRRSLAAGLALSALLPAGAVLTATARQLSSGELATSLFTSVFNDHAEDVCREIVASKALSTTPEGVYVGPNGVLESAETLWSAFPNGWFTILAMILDGEAASVRWAMTGNHLGAYAGVAPTGAPVTFEGISLVTLNASQVSSHRMLYDRMTVVDQVRHPVSYEADRPNGNR